jgi:DNA-binding response OmpR family regulator
VCEDDRSDARVAGVVLGTCGYDVVAEARLASEAVQLAAVWQPDVVLLDVHLLGMSGVEVLPALREVAPGAAVIVYTADDAVIDEASASGAHAVVDKTDPYALGEVLDRLQGRLRPTRLAMFDAKREPRWQREVRGSDTASVLTRLLDLNDVERQVETQLVGIA